MTKTEFHTLLVDSTRHSLDFAKKYVLDNLPNDFLYTVKLNSSNDDPTLKQFDLYPNDNGKVIKLISATEVVELLCRKEKVPVWIDISVESVYKDKTVFELVCAGRYSADNNEYYYDKRGSGPFGIKSPTFPIGYKNDDTKFYLRKKKSFFSWLTKK